MNKHPIHSVFFSPTGTTRRIIQAVRDGTGRTNGIEANLTRPQSDTIVFEGNDPVVIGMPVYGGRVPTLASERLKTVRGNRTPAVALVVYGNRAYGDALLELCDLCNDCGFRLIGAAAFIGEHSFSTPQQEIASGRPDRKDLDRAEDFGARVMNVVRPLDTNRIPGNRPYKPAMCPPGAAADSDLQTCRRCGQCISSCPAGAIRLTDSIPETDPDACIWCCACIKNCPTGSRRIISPKIREIAERLHTNFKERQEPQWFLADNITNH
jgi:ferredoxin